jgi:hypothetical protein
MKTVDSGSRQDHCLSLQSPRSSYTQARGLIGKTRSSAHRFMQPLVAILEANRSCRSRVRNAALSRTAKSRRCWVEFPSLWASNKTDQRNNDLVYLLVIESPSQVFARCIFLSAPISPRSRIWWIFPNCQVHPSYQSRPPRFGCSHWREQPWK